MADSKEDRVVYGIELINSLTRMLENDLSERLLTLMNFLPQLMASELEEDEQATQGS